jgi:hypothetical protein
VILLGFLPPQNLHLGSVYFYETFLMVGIIVNISLPTFIYRWQKAVKGS